MINYFRLMIKSLIKKITTILIIIMINCVPIYYSEVSKKKLLLYLLVNVKKRKIFNDKDLNIIFIKMIFKK